MADLYLISYDLTHHATMNQYEKLIGELRRLNAQKVQLSEWVWRGESTATALRDHLKAFIHSDDRLLVTTVGTWASYNSLIKINQV